MKDFLLITLLSGLVMLIGCALVSPKSQASVIYNITPANPDFPSDIKWTQYLCQHLDKRCSESDAVRMPEEGSANDKKELYHIIINVNSNLPKDYSITYTDKDVTLSAKNDDQMLWLLYQFMDILGMKDSRFDVSDLPPSLWTFGHNESGNMVFEYKSVYSPSNNYPEMFPIWGIGSLNYDWAIWGHNINKMVDPKTHIYAITEDPETNAQGVEDHDQYCFSSPELYKSIENYILLNYGEEAKDGKPVRFVIMPNDNNIVCQCSACRAVGNTKTSATPAVTRFIQRLSERFPNFLFFTSCYLTTASLPTQHLNPNVGVLISTMNLPMVHGFEGSKQGLVFADLFTKWKQLCPRIYVWDYCRNFDDYLTPFPYMEIARERILFYQKYGIQGVVFNGSGNDYASADDIQTYILSRLLINPNANINECFKRFTTRFYPVSGKLLTSYSESLEQSCIQRRIPLQYYGGIEDAIREYLDPEAFVNFFNELDKVSKQAGEDERARLNPLITALNFTRLELSRTPLGKHESNQNVSTFIKNLEGHTAFDNMINYKEANGNLDNYINYLKSTMTHGKDAGNVLQNQIFKVNSVLDDGSNPISILTDGYKGIPLDYHTGWLIVSADSLSVQFNSNGVSNGLLRIGFLNASKWHLATPYSVTLWQRGKRIAHIAPQSNNDAPFKRVVLDLNVNHVETNAPVRLIIKKSNNKIALDEVELFKK